MNGIVLTRDILLQALGADAVKDVGIALRTWRRAALKAHKAGFVDGAGTEHPPSPDHATRIKAADYLVKFHGAYPAEGTGEQHDRPVNVVINLTNQPASLGADLSTHGVRLHLSDGERNGA